MSLNKLEILFQEEEKLVDDEAIKEQKRNKKEELKRSMKEFLELFSEVRKVHTPYGEELKQSSNGDEIDQTKESQKKVE